MPQEENATKKRMKPFLESLIMDLTELKALKAFKFFPTSLFDSIPGAPVPGGLVALLAAA